MGSSTNIDGFNAVINFVSPSCLITLKQIISSWGAIFVMQVCDAGSATASEVLEGHMCDQKCC